MKRLAFVLFLFASSASAAPQKLDGFIPLYWDADTGKLSMEISRFGEELLYQTGLPAGLGSNPVGLDPPAFERFLAAV